MKKNVPLAIISGGTAGLGYAVAQKLSEIYDLALIYRSNDDRALKNFEALPKTNKIRIYRQNIIDNTSAEIVYKKIKNDFNTSPVVLINAAGYTPKQLFLATSFGDFKDVFDHHVFGVFALTQLVAADMYENTFGRIIGISSIATFSNQKGFSAYSSAKSALENFFKSIATELFHKNITVNIVQVGQVKENSDVKGIEKADVANLISFLIGESASSITGSKYLIDAGRGRWIN